MLLAFSADTAAWPQGKQTTQSAAGSVQPQPHARSDREIAGLHGPVDRCIEEMRYGQGDWHVTYDTSYDPEGRISQRSYTNNDGSRGVESFVYDSQGHLLRTVWTAQAGSSGTIYDYDSEGRLAGITGQGDWTTTFECDDRGRKTRIMKSSLNASDNGKHPTGISIGLDNADLLVFPRRRGWVETSFNEQDQPVESRVYESDGQLTQRLTRSYDAKGRVLESTDVIENFEYLLSRATRKSLPSDTETFEEMQAAVAEFLGDQKVLARMSYEYDEQGRISEERNNVGPLDETITKIRYNDYGDEAEAQTTSHHGDSRSQGDSRFSYQYDSLGNWTEKKLALRRRPLNPLSFDY